MRLGKTKLADYAIIVSDKLPGLNSLNMQTDWLKLNLQPKPTHLWCPTTRYQILLLQLSAKCKRGEKSSLSGDFRFERIPSGIFLAFRILILILLNFLFYNANQSTLFVEILWVHCVCCADASCECFQSFKDFKVLKLAKFQFLCFVAFELINDSRKNIKDFIDYLTVRTIQSITLLPACVTVTLRHS